MPGFESHPSGQMFFKIPEDGLVMAQLIEAVPNDWWCAYGGLTAPDDLIKQGIALPDTGIENHSIVGWHREGNRIISCAPDMIALLLRHKLPGFVDFRSNSYSRGSLQNIKQFAAGLITHGYRGSLLFGKSTPDDDDRVLYIDPYAAACSLELAPWTGHPNGAEPGEQPARVKLWWNEGRLGGKEEDIQSIAKICQKLRLTEYTPATPI